MNLRGVKLVEIAQMRCVHVPLVEWCLMRVVHSQMHSTALFTMLNVFLTVNALWGSVDAVQLNELNAFMW